MSQDKEPSMDEAAKAERLRALMDQPGGEIDAFVEDLWKGKDKRTGLGPLIIGQLRYFDYNGDDRVNKQDARAKPDSDDPDFTLIDLDLTALDKAMLQSLKAAGKHFDTNGDGKFSANESTAYIVHVIGNSGELEIPEKEGVLTTRDVADAFEKSLQSGLPAKPAGQNQR